MKFGHALLTSELSGAIGGAVASSARGGVGYFRVRGRPANPRTTAQTTMRLILSSLAGAWKSTLTTLQRTSWTDAATGALQGMSTFVKSNAQIRLAGGTVVTTAPASLALNAAEIFTDATVDASAHTIALDNDTPANVSANVYATVQQSASRDAREFPYQYVGTLVPGENTITLVATQPSYNLTAGRVVYVRVVQFAPTTAGVVLAGQIAEAQEFRSIVVA